MLLLESVYLLSNENGPEGILWLYLLKWHIKTFDLQNNTYKYILIRVCILLTPG